MIAIVVKEIRGQYGFDIVKAFTGEKCVVKSDKFCTGRNHNTGGLFYYKTLVVRDDQIE